MNKEIMAVLACALLMGACGGDEGFVTGFSPEVTYDQEGIGHLEASVHIAAQEEQIRFGGLLLSVIETGTGETSLLADDGTPLFTGWEVVTQEGFPSLSPAEGEESVVRVGQFFELRNMTSLYQCISLSSFVFRLQAEVHPEAREKLGSITVGFHDLTPGLQDCPGASTLGNQVTFTL